jgi:hypothetical protein
MLGVVLRRLVGVHDRMIWVVFRWRRRRRCRRLIQRREVLL